MTYRPSLILQPCHNSYAAILHAFQSGKPLSAEQLNFLLWHARQLSSAHLDPLLKYYKIGKPHTYQHSCVHSFLVADELENKESTERFKFKLECLLQEQHHGIMAKFTMIQFEHLMAIEHVPHLVYFDSNRIVIDSPLFRGKKAHVYFFQWGNIIGIVKFEVVKDAPIYETNALVYFEERRNRELTEFIHDFYLKYNADMELLNKQQYELQEQLRRFNLQNEMVQKDVLEKELLEYQNRLTEAENYEHLKNERLLNQHIEQERLENEKIYQEKLLQEELLEAQQQKEQLTEEKNLESQRVIEEKLEAQIADLHKDPNYRPSTIFPPRYEMRPPFPVDKSKESK